ncbi:MAG: hypothetical protein Ct9H300mP11_10310 [Chloroflexota bacterium]|nr:MAG: hypothetical protein Ct9H300mP11_10310 [Chloroflexota bacterium]
MSSDIDHNFTDTPIKIAGIGQATGKPLHDSDELTSLSAAKAASQQAYDMAGITFKDIDLAEVHDVSQLQRSWLARILVSSLREKVQSGGRRPYRSGRRPSDQHLRRTKSQRSSSRRIWSRQVIEIYHQLRGEAGNRQVKKADPTVGITHNVGEQAEPA